MGIQVYEVGPDNKLIKNDNSTSLDESIKMLVAEEPVSKADIDKNLYEFLMLECDACKGNHEGQDQFVKNFFKKQSSGIVHKYYSWLFGYKNWCQVCDSTDRDISQMIPHFNNLVDKTPMFALSFDQSQSNKFPWAEF